MLENFAEQHRVDWLTAEFYHTGTEARFREYIRDSRIRDTSLAIALAGTLYLAFVYTDIAYSKSMAEVLYAILSRTGVFLVGLAGAYLAARYPKWLLNGVIPSTVASIALVQYLMIMHWIDYEFGVRGMGMMVMLFGVYVFIPNRYQLALMVAVFFSIAYLISSLTLFRVDSNQFSGLIGHLLVTNLMGAMIAHRVSRLMREQFRDQALVTQANLRLHVEMEERQRLESALRQRAENDEVCGVANRGALFERFGRMQHDDVILLLIDVDYFRQIKGTYGHLRSDEVLRTLVSVIRSLLGENQFFGRLGGEEFVVLLPRVGLDEASALAERIRAECQRTPVIMEDLNVHFTVSIGMIKYRPGESFNVALRRADEAAAAAKYKGRNRVEVAA